MPLGFCLLGWWFYAVAARSPDMGLITGLIGLCIRIGWFVCVGWWLGGLYLALMFLMSPFGTLSSTKIFDNAQKIMFLSVDD